MEAPTNEIIENFEIEGNFTKTKLENLKDSKNGYLTGKCFYGLNIPDLQYFIKVYPNGENEEHRGETWLYLRINSSEKITADFTVLIESVNYSERFSNSLETKRQVGIKCCKTPEFFDSNNNYFVNGEIIVKVKGTFKAEKLLVTESSYPISMQWKIKEKDLNIKKETNGFLCSEKIDIPSLPDVKYFLSINPNESPDEIEENVEIYLNVEFENDKKIKTLYDITVDSANSNCICVFTFVRPREYGRTLCLTKDLFNPAKRYIVDGFLIVNLNGILLIETNEAFNSNMECSTNEIVCPFDTEWKFKKSDLMALKDSEKDFLRGKYFYKSSPGLQYHLFIRPYVNREEQRGETWIFLCVKNCSEDQKTIANFDICIESANFSESLNFVYQNQNSNGWGETCCKTSEFFKTNNNKYFVNGEITIRVKGIFKAQRPLISELSFPISMQWNVKKEDFKQQTERFLLSKRIIVPLLSDVKYYLSIDLNEIGENDISTVYIYFNLENGNKKKIKAVFNFSIESVNYFQGIEYTFEESIGYGLALCSTNDFFDPTKGYFKDEVLTVNLNGILLFENTQDAVLNFDNETSIKKYKQNEDFVVVVGDKEIQVHKQILMDASPVFIGMFNSGMKETIENKITIKEFSFEIVEAALDLLYGSKVPQNFELHDLLLLYQFGEKYEIKLVMDLIVDSLIKEISPANVCQLEKFSTDFNVSKLHQSCIDFLIKCSKESTPICGPESLDKDLIFEIFLSSFRSTVDTDD